VAALNVPVEARLHDTPARSLFALGSRALSHGCIRLENPTAWPSGWWRAIRRGQRPRKTTRAPLVPVYAFYWTTFVDEQGQIQFRRDVYGWDAKLPKLMGLRVMRFDLDSWSSSRA
jgi:murein L,D-transpeptidase YcbB/YkuD